MDSWCSLLNFRRPAKKQRTAARFLLNFVELCKCKAWSMAEKCSRSGWWVKRKRSYHQQASSSPWGKPCCWKQPFGNLQSIQHGRNGWRGDDENGHWNEWNVIQAKTGRQFQFWCKLKPGESNWRRKIKHWRWRVNDGWRFGQASHFPIKEKNHLDGFSWALHVKTERSLGCSNAKDHFAVCRIKIRQYHWKSRRLYWNSGKNQQNFRRT